MDRVGARLRRGGDDVYVDVGSGVVSLDAESEWIIEGDDTSLDQVRHALGSRVCTRMARGLLVVRFGNHVGKVDAGPLGRWTIRSGKWTEDDYDTLLEDLSRVTAALPFTDSAPSSLPYERTSLDAPEVLYHAFVWLRHAVLPQRSELREALDNILRQPHQRLARASHEVPVALARRVGPRVLQDIATGRWPLVAASVGPGGRGLPRSIEEEQVRQSVDTAENRFVKAFLVECLWVVEKIRSLDGGRARRLVLDCDRLDEALFHWHRAALWREVGALTHFPQGSAVLQRRFDYRAVVRHHQMLRLGSRVPLDPAMTHLLLESKDIATLYELWTAFTVLDEVRAQLGPPSQLVRVAADHTGATVRRGLVARWDGGTELAYNYTFTRMAGFHGRSRSLPLRPDVALFVPSGASLGLHLFDAKFRLQGSLDPEAQDPASFKRGDLDKMHAYRDAIPDARSAWVLYPGDSDAIFLDDGARQVGDCGARVQGVGALGLKPGGRSEVFRRILRTMLNVGQSLVGVG